MSFQAYIENIESKTQMSIETIYQKALKEGILVDELRATDFVNWCEQSLTLGRGHAMALWKYFLEKGWIINSTSKVLKEKK